ncbi:MAG: ABC transporter permease subunit [Mobilitalea sp.]
MDEISSSELITQEVKNMKQKPNQKEYAETKDYCDKEYKGRKIGVWVTAITSLLTILLSLPFVKWIGIVNSASLYGTWELKEEVITGLDSRYSLFNILSFVQDTKQGMIGLFSMILFLLMAATVFFHVKYVLQVLLNKKGKHGNLSLYVSAQTAQLFSMILSVTTIGYIVFANNKFEMTGFTLSQVVIVIFVIEAVSYLIIKKMEAKEWKLYHEHGFLKEVKKNWVLFAMLIPTFIYFLINNYLPMLGVYYAFTNFNFRDGLWASPFVGFKNFDHLMKADLFKLTRNTVLYNLVFIGLGNVLQIIFAIFVSQVAVKWFKKVSQTLMFMPYFVSFVILKVLVYNIFEYDYGIINSVITSLGGAKIDFYNTPSYWPVLITVFFIWKNLGYGMVVYLATIMGIDTEFYEAAKVDGANIFQQIRYITLPLLKPTFIILLLYALGSIMKGQFELFYQMVGTNGVLFNATDIFDTYVYRITTTQPLSIGIGTAAGLYQSLFGFIIIMVTNWLVKKKNPEYALF